MKRIVKFAVVLSCVFIISAIIFVCFQLNYSMTIFDASVLRTLFWSCLVLSVTLLIAYIGQKSRITKQLEEYSQAQKNKERYNKIVSRYHGGLSELLENTAVLFICALLMFVIEPLSEIDIPFLIWPFIFEKAQAVAYVKLTFLLSSALAILDNLISTVNILRSIKYELTHFE